jgi:hypothetical protein
MIRALPLLLLLLLLCSCATVPPCVGVDDFNQFRYDTYRALDSLRHRGPAWEGVR